MSNKTNTQTIVLEEPNFDDIDITGEKKAEINHIKEICLDKLDCKLIYPFIQKENDEIISAGLRFNYQDMDIEYSNVLTDDYSLIYTEYNVFYNYIVRSQSELLGGETPENITMKYLKESSDKLNLTEKAYILQNNRRTELENIDIGLLNQISNSPLPVDYQFKTPYREYYYFSLMHIFWNANLSVDKLNKKLIHLLRLRQSLESILKAAYIPNEITIPDEIPSENPVKQSENKMFENQQNSKTNIDIRGYQ